MSAMVIESKCPCEYEFCTWNCDICNKKFSIKKTKSYGHKIKINKNHNKILWICPTCKEKELQNL